ncbi:MAG: bifunctional hydroxymethylpyrimidine kinase/phosphomethylpyrimidine kinase, partial [Coprobacillus sp.]
MKKVLTIAGTDCSGGAGVQADIKTITVHGMYAMSAITALTAQNTLGVQDIMEVTPHFLEEQLDCIFEDIYPDSVKIGMVSNISLIETIVKKLKQYHVKNIVVDPVMVSTSGSKLLEENAIETLKTQLLPIASVITPNIPEAEILCGFTIHDEKDMIQAAKEISKYVNGGILIKGGHLVSEATDLLYQDGQIYWFQAKRVNNPNTHGTGCTLSSAIACHLADGYSLQDSIKNAKGYLTGALQAQLDLGRGSGPLNHMY